MEDLERMNQIQEELDHMIIDLERKEKAGRQLQKTRNLQDVSEKDGKEEGKKREKKSSFSSFDINYFLYTILALSICLIVVTPIVYIRLK